MPSHPKDIAMKRKVFEIGDTEIPYDFMTYRGAEGPWFDALAIARALGLPDGSEAVERFAQANRDTLDDGEYLSIGAWREDSVWMHSHSLFHVNAVLKLILLAETPEARKLKAEVMNMPCLPHAIYALGESVGLEVGSDINEVSGPERPKAPVALTIALPWLDGVAEKAEASDHGQWAKPDYKTLSAPGAVVIDAAKPTAPAPSKVINLPANAHSKAPGKP